MSITGSSGRPEGQARAGRREVKFAGAPLAAVSGDGLFEGYASLFGVVDLGRDRWRTAPSATAWRARGRGPSSCCGSMIPLIRSASGRISSRMPGAEGARASRSLRRQGARGACPDAVRRGRRPLHRLQGREVAQGRCDWRASSRKARSLGGFDRHLSHAAGRQGVRREAARRAPRGGPCCGRDAQRGPSPFDRPPRGRLRTTTSWPERRPHGPRDAPSALS